MNLRTFLGSLPLVQLPLPFLLPPQKAAPQQAPAKAEARRSGTPTGDARELETALGERLRQKVVVEVHDNRSTMVSFRRHADALRIRLHHMFLPPVPSLATTLADFVDGRSRRRAEAGRWLDGWIKEHQASIRPAKPPTLANRTGRAHDLQAIFDSLNREFFDGTVTAEIGWGRAPTKRRRRTIKMGVYLHDHRQIRIHPALDHPDVPHYFVAFVTYHEMCHQICPPESTQAGRSRVHTASFKARERLYPERAQALAWEKAHLGKLLRRS